MQIMRFTGLEILPGKVYKSQEWFLKINPRAEDSNIPEEKLAATHEKLSSPLPGNSPCISPGFCGFRTESAFSFPDYLEYFLNAAFL